MNNEHPEHKETIHGHVTYCDDQQVIWYLKHLDQQEANALYKYAKEHRATDFEMKRKDGARFNYRLVHANGAFVVEDQGKQSTGWF